MPVSRKRKNHNKKVESRKLQTKALQTAMKTLLENPDSDPTLLFNSSEPESTLSETIDAPVEDASVIEGEIVE